MPKRTPVHPAPEHARAHTQRTANTTGLTEETIIPVVREELDVGTRRVETDAGVRVRKTVEEKVQLIDEPLHKDELAVERVAVGCYVAEPVAIRYEGETMVVPVLEEVLVVEKRLLLKEEVRITRRRSEHRNPQRVTLREEHAEVERFRDGEVVSAADPHAPQRVEDRAYAARAAHSDVAGHAGGPDGDESLIERRRRVDDEQRSDLARMRR
jgi:uncharacterized protein (TIGR02271 family)